MKKVEKKEKSEKGSSFVTTMVERLKVLKEILSISVFILLAVIFIPYIFKGHKKRTIVISPFTAKNIEPLKYEGNYLAAALRHNLSEITNIKTYEDTTKGVSYFQEKTYTLKEPISGLNLSSLKSYLHREVFNSQISYTGFLGVTNDKKYILFENSRSQSFKYTFQNGIELDSILEIFAEEIIKETDPYQLGVYYLHKKIKTEKCLELSQDILNDNNLKNDYKGLLLRGNYYIRNRNLDSGYHFKSYHQLALDDFKQVIHLRPVASAFNNIGYIYEQRNKIDSSIYYYKSAIKHDKKFHGAYLNIGNCFIKKYNQEKHSIIYLDSAKIYYEKAIDLKKDSPLHYLSLGMVYEKKGEKEKALELYYKALQIDLNEPYYPLYHLGIAMKESNPKLAIHYLRKSKELFERKKLKFPASSLIDSLTKWQKVRDSVGMKK